MKNYSILTLLAALLFVGCSDIFVELESPLTNETTLPDLTANFADDGLTRTYVEAGKYLRWHEADLITAFFGNTLNRQYKFKGKTGDNSGTFSLVPDGELGTGNTLDAIYAIYPYDASATISDEGLISLTLPSEQSYAENSFGKGANTMVAVTESVEDTLLSFKNACGYLKLYLYNVDGATLKSVSVKGNNNENIAGAATATIEFGGVPTIVMGNDATTTVTLNCGEGIALDTSAEEATALWIVLPETTFENGITISATDTKGGVFEKSTSNTVAITRNDIQPMAALEVEFVPAEVKPANNEIYYTNGSTTEATTLYKTNVFGANIVSNTYDAEKECWVIKFDGDVTSIGHSAFRGCSSLTSVTIPDSVTWIGDGAFSGCSNLTSITIPDSVTEIGQKAFSGCTGELIVNCNIPSASYIYEGAFCDSKFTKVTIGDSVTSIGDYAFYYCSSLTSVYYNGDLSDWCNIDFYNYDSNPLNNGAKLYINNTEVTEITIPSDISVIKNYTFCGCSSLTSITIPDSVTSIGSFAFEDCSSLTSVYCKATTPPAGEIDMFYNNASGRTIYVPTESVSAYKTAENWSDYADAIIGYDFEKGEVVPEETNNNLMIAYTATEKIVKSEWKFNTFGANIVSHEWDSETGEGVITFDADVTTIGEKAFYYSTTLTSVTIPDSVTTIGADAFYDCTSLTSVTIGNSVTTIGYGAFSSCESLAKFNGKFAEDNGRILVIDGTLVAFAPAGITEYTIPDSVTTIGEYAFYYCYNLTSVTIPDSVATIGNIAFNSCKSLTSVYCKAITPPVLGYYYVFDYNDSGRKIYVPTESVNAYKSASCWSDYASSIEPYNF